MADPVRGLLGGAGLGGVFYLHGAEELQKGEAARALVEAHLDPATRDFNLDRLRGRELEVEQLASVLATPPMMAEWRVVVVTEVEALAGSPRAREVLLEAAGTPPPGLALILVCTVPDRSKARFYRDLAKAARSHEFKPLAVDDVPGWLMQRAAEDLGVEMEPEAARALAQAVGTELGVLAQELEKLSGFVRDGEPITREAVQAAGTVLPSQDRWAWFDLVGSKRFHEALGGLPVLLGQGESGVGLTIGLASHFLRLAVVVYGGPRALEQVLPPHQRWLARGVERQARLWTRDEVGPAVAGLRQLDRRLKSSGTHPEALIQNWLLGLMARKAA